MAKQGGFGLVVKIDVSSTLTAIANILDGEFPEQERVVAEATTHDSTDGYAEWISTGLRQLNEFKLTLAWDDSEATHAAILTAFDAEAAVDMSVEDPDGTEVIAFSALVTKLGRVSQMKEVYQAEVTFQPTGAPTITT